ncbi:MAG: hypothetical protein ACE5IK_01830 [Acidobacteriota bacterium]
MKSSMLVMPALAVAVGTALCGVASAQGTRPGIPSGKGYFYPSIEFAAEDNSNIFRDDENPIDAQVYDSGANLEWRFPLSRSSLSLAYTPRYRVYSDDLLPSTVNHIFDADLAFEFRNGARLGLTENFERGIQQLKTVTASEADFNGDKFTSNEGHVDLRLPLGRHQFFDVAAFSRTVSFDQPDEASFFDFSEFGGSVGWSVSMTHLLEYRLEARGRSNAQDRQDLEFTDFNTDLPVVIPDFQEEDFKEVVLRTGLDGKLGTNADLQVFYGYGVMRFENSAEGDFEGSSFDVDARFILGRAWGVRLRASRHPRQSFFNVSNFFVSEVGSLDVTWASPRRLQVSVGGSVQANRYPDPIVTDIDSNPATGADAAGNEILPDPAGGLVAGVIRRDDLSLLRARLQFTFRPDRLLAFVEVLDERRASNLSFVQSDGTTVRVGVRFGWLPPTGGGI